jgi:hypothetical protein
MSYGTYIKAFMGNGKNDEIKLTIKSKLSEYNPVVSLFVEANEFSLKNGHIKLDMQYASKLKAYSSDFAHDCVFYPLYENVYHKQPNTIKFDDLRIKSYIENSNINLIQNLAGP